MLDLSFLAAGMVGLCQCTVKMWQASRSICTLVNGAAVPRQDHMQPEAAHTPHHCTGPYDEKQDAWHCMQVGALPAHGLSVKPA